MPPEQMPTNPPPSAPYAPLPPIAPAPKRSAWQVAARVLRWLWLHMGLKMRVFIVVFSILSVMALIQVALAGKPDGSHAPSSTTTSNVTSTSGADYTSPSQLSVACGSHGQAVKGNDKYRSSSAPYHIAIFEQSQYYQDQQYDYTLPSDAITDATVGPAMRPVDPQSTQLIACLDRVSQASTGKSCPFTPVDLPIYSATYQLTVYEAATHRVVLQKPVASVPLYTTRDNCPAQAKYNPKDPRIYYPVDGYSLASALKSVVQ